MMMKGLNVSLDSSSSFDDDETAFETEKRHTKES